MIKNSIIGKYATLLVFALLVVFYLEACTKEKEEPTCIITMTTKASEVNISIGIKAGDDKSGNLTIDWGDGKKGNITDVISNDGSGLLGFSHEYSGNSEYGITITGDNIVGLECVGYELTALDVSRNTALTSLVCSYNQLTVLDVSRCTALTSLQCGGNQLTVLDVSRNTILTSLYCGNNQLTALDVSRNTALTSLECKYNQLTALDVSKNTALIYLYISSNQLKNLDVNKNIALGALNVEFNQLTAAVLNDIFRALPSWPLDPEYVGDIRITGNPGTDECDWSIAIEKGWHFIFPQHTQHTQR